MEQEQQHMAVDGMDSNLSIPLICPFPRSGNVICSSEFNRLIISCNIRKNLEMKSKT